MAAKKTINLALQGGGAHGAYTWGVLDRLLEEDNIHIDGISGTSAGAMNAAMMVSGWMNGGRDGAKKQLETFWRRISEVGALSPLHKMPWERMLTGWNMDLSPSYLMMDLLSRVFSPYTMNPLNLNPMRSILDDLIDHDAVHTCPHTQLFITATHVTSGQAQVFRNKHVTTDVLLASACIPFLFQSIEINGEPYWDGGYTGNPAIWPLIYNCESEDVVLVQINPIHDARPAHSASEIINRMNEITFNSSLIAEMRAIDFVSRLLQEGSLDPKRYKDMRIHVIYAAESMKHLNASSKLNADWDFFVYLKEIGRQTADAWLKRDWNLIGVRSSIDIREKFLMGPDHRHYYGGDLSEKKSYRQEQQKMKKDKQV